MNQTFQRDVVQFLKNVRYHPSIFTPRKRASCHKYTYGRIIHAKAENGVLSTSDISDEPHITTLFERLPSTPTTTHNTETPLPSPEQLDDIIQSIKSIIQTNNTEAALAAIQQLSPPTPTIISTAVSAFAQKNGIKGIRAMEKTVKKRRFWTSFTPDQKLRLVFSFIRAYGRVGSTDDVERLFRGALQAQLLTLPLQNPRHVTMYLHALHSDIDLVFFRAEQLLFRSHALLSRKKTSSADIKNNDYINNNNNNNNSIHDATTRSVFETASFNVLLKACMRAKDASKTDLVLQWMNQTGAQPDDITYSCLIKAHSYADDFERVLQVYDRMMKRSDDDGANNRHIMYNTISTTNNTTSNTPQQQQLYTPSADVWGDLLIACGRAKHPETMLMIWREAKEALGGATNVPTDVYNALLTACNAAGLSERSLIEFEEMKNVGAVPSTRTYNLAIKACEAAPGQRLRADRLVTALVLYLEMQSKGVPADEFTYGSLMELCAEGRQGRIAAQLRDRMIAEEIKPNSIIWTSLMKAMVRSKMVDEALIEFKKMVWGPARLKPSRTTFRILITELRECGALCAALRAYEGMRRARFAPNNKDFQELVGAAAEAVLVQDDVELQQQLASICRITSLEEIDLHGMSSYEARAAVLCVLSMLTTSYRRQSLLPGNLTIITGKGGHSEGNKAVLPSIVLRLLVDELHIRVPEMNDKNPGRIVVKSEEVERWLRQRVG